MNPHGVSQLYLVKLSSGCLRVKRVRQKPVTSCVERVKHNNQLLEEYHDEEQRSSGGTRCAPPDSFAGAVVEGRDPASAVVLSTAWLDLSLPSCAALACVNL